MYSEMTTTAYEKTVWSVCLKARERVVVEIKSKIARRQLDAKRSLHNILLQYLTRNGIECHDTPIRTILKSSLDLPNRVLIGDFSREWNLYIELVYRHSSTYLNGLKNHPNGMPKWTRMLDTCTFGDAFESTWWKRTPPASTLQFKLLCPDNNMSMGILSQGDEVNRRKQLYLEGMMHDARLRDTVATVPSKTSGIDEMKYAMEQYSVLRQSYAERIFTQRELSVVMLPAMDRVVRGIQSDKRRYEHWLILSLPKETDEFFVAMGTQPIQALLNQHITSTHAAYRATLAGVQDYDGLLEAIDIMKQMNIELNQQQLVSIPNLNLPSSMSTMNEIAHMCTRWRTWQMLKQLTTSQTTQCDELESILARHSTVDLHELKSHDTDIQHFMAQHRDLLNLLIMDFGRFNADEFKSCLDGYNELAHPRLMADLKDYRDRFLNNIERVAGDAKRVAPRRPGAGAAIANPIARQAADDDEMKMVPSIAVFTQTKNKILRMLDDTRSMASTMPYHSRRLRLRIIVYMKQYLAAATAFEKAHVCKWLDDICHVARDCIMSGEATARSKVQEEKQAELDMWTRYDRAKWPVYPTLYQDWLEFKGMATATIGPLLGDTPDIGSDLALLKSELLELEERLYATRPPTIKTTLRQLLTDTRSIDVINRFDRLMKNVNRT